MAVYPVSPEEDKLFKSQGLSFITPLMPFASAMNLEKNAPGKVLNFGLGDFSLLDNPALYDKSIANTYKGFSDRGVSVLDPSHPLGMGSSLPLDSGGTYNLDTMIANLLKGFGTGGANGAGLPGLPAGNPGSALVNTAKGNNLLFADRYTAPANPSDKFFQDYLTSLTGPSSSEDALKSVEGQGLEQLLAEIDRETAGQVGSAKLDFLDRGISGPGQVSDIEANAIAQLKTGGARNKAAARTSVLTSQLGRQAEKEKAKSAALGLRYTTGAAADIAGRDIAARGAQSDSQILAQLLGTQYQGGITQAEGAQNRTLELIGKLLTTSMQGKELNQQDRQFLQKLMAEAEQNSLNRSSNLATTKMGLNNASDIAAGNNQTAIITSILGGLL
jgi:hypothetical protein